MSTSREISGRFTSRIHIIHILYMPRSPVNPDKAVHVRHMNRRSIWRI